MNMRGLAVVKFDQNGRKTREKTDLPYGTYVMTEVRNA